MSQLADNCKITRHLEVCATFIDNELVMMGPEDKIYYRINSSGLRIWNFLESNTYTLQEIVDYIANDYKVEPSRVLDGVQAFILLLLEKKILRYV